MTITVFERFLNRRGLASQWTSVNPVLGDGEIGLETDTGKFKFGDGVTVWTGLPYSASGGGGGAVDSVNSQTGVVVLTAADVGADVSGAATTAQNDAETFATEAVGTETSRAEGVEGTLSTAIGAETSRAETAEELALHQAANLADLANPATARTSLGLGTAATHPTTDFDAAGLAAAAAAASVALSGGTMTGPLVLSGAPTTSGQAATKAYVDAAVTGLSIKTTVVCATTTALPANNYSNGTAGVGATLTGQSVGVLTVDTHAVALNDSVLVKNEAGQLANGIYTCTTAGSAGAAYVLTRRNDNNESTEFVGAYTFVTGGSANEGSGWLCANTTAPTLGSTAITFNQFSSSSTYTADGTTITLTGSQFSVTPGAFLAPAGSGAALTGITAAQVGADAAGLAAAETARAETAEALLAPKASPGLTGTPTAPTKTPLTNSTAVATTAYADAAVGVETTRAEAAESTNATAISTETTRATTAEGLKAAKASNLSDMADAGSSRFNIAVPGLSAAAAVATTNVSLSAPGATIDGYTLLTNDEVLLTGQTTTSQNGVWIWSGASSALVRPNEFPSAGVVKRGRVVMVASGTNYGGTMWLLAAPNAGLTIDTTAQTWIALNITGTVGNESLITAQSLSSMGAPTANIPFAGNKITGLGVGSGSGDSVAFQQLPLETTFIGLFTTVASGSNGVNINTFAGSGILSVASNAGAATAGIAVIQLANGSAQYISYTGLGTNTLTGCTALNGSSGSMVTGQAVSLAVVYTPAVSGTYDFDIVGGGGGGAGAGSAATSGTNQAGAGGGGSGMTVRSTQTLVGGTTYSITVGAGGTGGLGGNASGNPGILGINGAHTCVDAASIVIATGGGGGAPSTATSTAAAGGGTWGGSGAANTTVATSPGGGGGGSAFSTFGGQGAPPICGSAGGGGGGSSASSTVGGSGGAAGNFLGGAAGGAVAGSGHIGGTGANAAANSGGGGGGGGGGCGAATAGAGGPGGNGGSGYVTVRGPLL